jgi:hypothetical protein
MANAAIAYVNLADTATITTSSQEILLPALNVQNPHIARKWRGQGSGTDFLVFDLGSSVPLNTLATFGITGTSIRYRVSSVDSTGASGDVYDSGTLSVDQAYLSSIVLPATISGRYVRVDISIASGYVEAGRVYIGVRQGFTYNFSRGWQRAWVDRSTRTKTRGGQTQVYPDSTYRTVDVTFDFISRTDRNGFVETIDRVNATKTDVLFIGDTASTNLARDSIWGLMVNLSPVVEPYSSAFTKQYQIEERL